MKTQQRPRPVWIAMAIASTLTLPLAAELTIATPRCEYLVNPLGIDTSKPRLSWVVESTRRNERQSAYQVLVSSSTKLLQADKGDYWDSGKVPGEMTNQVVYGGVPLKSRMRCHWKVRSWDKDGKPSAWSTPASWSVGLLEASDWTAKWIDASAVPKPVKDGEMPTIIKATYEAIDGSGTLDLTEKLTGLAKGGSFNIDVGNESLGGDPSYLHAKQLRVEYEIAGRKTVRLFAEKSKLRFPGDLSTPPAIRSAVYQAIDGSGSLDVTSKMVKLAKDGSFSIAVENDVLGADPALDRVKQLCITYVSDGQTSRKTIPEKSVFHYPTDLAPPATVPYLRKKFELTKSVTRATVYATALGIYELRLNGKRVGDSFLAPEWTDYNKRLSYQEYDVTPLIAAGANILAAQVAHGWYSGHIGNGGYQYWGKSPALLAQLEVEYADGSNERIITDQSWKSHVSPMLSSDFMMGEVHDATKELQGWERPDYDDSGWPQVVERVESARAMQGHVMEPVRVLSEIQPKSLKEPKVGKWTYDLGQNMVGVVRLKVMAPTGTRITLRHAEMLNPDGTIYTQNLRGAPSIDTYICKGGGVEVWQPKFTFHGFRYVELTGLPGVPTKETVTGIVIGSDVPKVGEFVCSDPQINQLQSNIEWGQRGNYLSVPTDCPQRDERLGWMGDAQVFVKTATYNGDVAAFYNKWLVDVTDSQEPSGAFADVSPFAGPSKGTPAWGDAGVICPWTIYQTYGDAAMLARQYPSMVKWLEFCGSHSPGHIRSGKRGSDYGDWLSIGADTDKELIGTAYYAYSASLVAKAAMALGKKDDAETYRKLFESIKAAFIEKYVSPDGRVQSNTQCAYLMALKFDLLPDSLRAKAADHLEADIITKDYHLSTGFVGVSYLLPELTKAGKVETAYKLLHQDTFPSWLFSVKMGATTIWERWDGWTPEKGFQDAGMNSFNHYSLGSCGEWMFSTVAGIAMDPETPGFRKIVIKPVPGGKLTQAAARLRSIQGLISSAWQVENGNFALNTTIPANTTARVYVPTSDAASVLESGKPAADAEGVKFVAMENGYAVYQVGSGTYRFLSRGGASAQVKDSTKDISSK